MGKEKELTASKEDYLETIRIIEGRRKVVRVRDIARKMNLRMPSVTGALKVLSENGLVSHEKYEYVELTPEGRKVARRVQRTHNILFKFFTEVIGVDTDTAEKDACKVEHAISATTLEKLVQFMELFGNEN